MRTGHNSLCFCHPCSPKRERQRPAALRMGKGPSFSAPCGECLWSPCGTGCLAQARASIGRARHHWTAKAEGADGWGGTWEPHRHTRFLPQGPLLTDAAPGAPQEKDETNARELQDLQAQLSEAKHQQSLARQGLSQLQQLLQEEQERRLAAEEACSAAQEQMRRLESEEYAESLETTIAMPPSPEHARLLGSAESSFSKARGARGLQRALRSLFCPRRLFSLLATVYLFGIHVLLLLHAVGRL